MTLIERWRTGRKVGRTIYAYTEDDYDGRMIGVMDTPELAAEAVDAREQLRGAVDTSAIEAIIHDWTCGCGQGQACPRRGDCREAADQIVSRFGGAVGD